MSYSNQTPNLGLPQWTGSDKPTYLVDQNGAYDKIDQFAGDTEDSLTQLENDLDTLSGRVTTAEGKQATDEANIAGLQSQVGLLQTTVASFGASITNLTHDVNTAQSDIDTVEGAVNTLTGTTIPAMQTQADNTENQLSSDGTAQGTKFYFDIKNGVAGYNTSAARGADTFNPFRSGEQPSRFTFDRITIPIDACDLLVNTTSQIETKNATAAQCVTGYRIDCEKILNNLKARGIIKSECTLEAFTKIFSGFNYWQTSPLANKPYGYNNIQEGLLFNLRPAFSLENVESTSSGIISTKVKAVAGYFDRTPISEAEQLSMAANNTRTIPVGTSCVIMISNDFKYLYYVQADTSDFTNYTLKLMSCYAYNYGPDVTPEAFSINPNDVTIIGSPSPMGADTDGAKYLAIANAMITATAGIIVPGAITHEISDTSRFRIDMPVLRISLFDGAPTGNCAYMKTINDAFINSYINA